MNQINFPNEDYQTVNYFQSKSGLLVPDPMWYFSDCGAHAISGIRAVITMAEEGRKFKEEGAITSEILNHEIMRVKFPLDEILAIVDPSNSYGIVNSNRKGVWHPDYTDVFNTTILRGVFDRVDKPLFDFDSMKRTENYEPLMNYWNEIRNAYYARDEVINKIPDANRVTPALAEILAK